MSKMYQAALALRQSRHAVYSCVTVCAAFYSSQHYTELVTHCLRCRILQYRQIGPLTRWMMAALLQNLAQVWTRSVSQWTTYYRAGAKINRQMLLIFFQMLEKRLQPMRLCSMHTCRHESTVLCHHAKGPQRLSGTACFSFPGMR